MKIVLLSTVFFSWVAFVFILGMKYNRRKNDNVKPKFPYFVYLFIGLIITGFLVFSVMVMIR
jgi:hypothetical protein